MERYPRLQKVQRMLGVLEQALKQAERGSNPGVTILLVRGGDQAGVYLRVISADSVMQEISLAEELGLSGGETVGLFRWAESECYVRPNYGGSTQISPGAEVPTAGLDHLETKGYELIGELPDPQERMEFILEAALAAAVQASDRPEEKKRWQGLREDFRFVLRTLGVEGAKAVLRGDMPPM